jgi:hypothetical protein
MWPGAAASDSKKRQATAPTPFAPNTRPFPSDARSVDEDAKAEADADAEADAVAPNDADVEVVADEAEGRWVVLPGGAQTK